ncbi:replication factor-a protein [Mollisia scopiformis]|uniref:Replication protein A subunit n=1 Tax=Mollisia scopiformis TaxID=149040 RepID=A0A194WWH9_MOLSC|nr:replication factor-a protein [Mollisia scopiformis]KUJ11932.1 replication factor-a protein [Mollisia scopiformis]
MAEAAARAQITQGALNAIFNDPETLQQNFPVPVCQCVQIKALSSSTEGGAERYRIVLSDIKNFVQSMLATQANHVIHDGKLKKGSIVRLKNYQANAVKGKRILIILDLEVIESLGELEKIDNPVGLTVKEESDDSKPVSTTIAGGGFYGSKPQAAEPVKQEQRTLPSRTGPSSSASHSNLYPIEGLSPYAHKWTIKARVTHKSDIRTWHKQNSEGKLFSVNLLDESSEIKATGFNEQCDQLYDVFQEGAVYYISSPCRVQLAKKQFSTLPNDYELTFERDTLVEKAEDVTDVPQVRYNFTTIGALQDVEKDSTIDVIGVLKEVADVTQITSKTTQKPFDKRELTLVDDSGFSVRLTIWGKTATAFDAETEAIVAFKGTKVGDFGGRSLSLLSSGSMAVNPDIPEAHKLKGWYDSQGRTEHFNSHTGMAGAGAAGGRNEQLKTIAQVREENLGMSENNDYFSTKGTIVYIKQENFAYPACASPDCNKKVTDMGDGTWHCEKCNVTHQKPEYRYIMSVNVNDHTGQMYLSCFDDVGRLIMGMSGDSLMELKENDSAAAQKVFEDANCKTYTFKVRAKMDTFQDQQRVRYQVIGAVPIDYKTEALKLANLIKQYHMND